MTVKSIKGVLYFFIAFGFSICILASSGSCAVISSVNDHDNGFSQKIVAVIRNNPISSFNVSARSRFVVLASGLENHVSFRTALDPIILNVLIEEEIQRQAAIDGGIVLNPEEISHAITSMEQGNNMSLGSLDDFFKKNHLPRSVLEKQIEARIFWEKYIKKKYLPNIHITDEEVDLFLDNWVKRQTSTQYHLFEITLHVTNFAEEKLAYKNAKMILDLLKKGVPFPSLATQFSESYSSKQGGDLGWLGEMDLHRSGYFQAISESSAGRIIGPLRVKSGLVILWLMEKKHPTPMDNLRKLSQDEIKILLANERLGVLARQEMAYLKQSFWIDKRS